MTASIPPAGSWLPGRPEQPYRVGFGGGLQPGDQVAEPLGAADPGRRHERGQAERLCDLGQPGGASRLVSSRGSPLPPSSALMSGFARFRRPGSVPPQIRPVPANRAAASSRAW